MKLCSHDSYPVYVRLIGPLRKRARQLGYAIGVHGSLRRDIDLIACPWQDGAVSAKVLAEELRLVIVEVCGYAFNVDKEHADNPQYFEDGAPGAKPFGRLGWCFHVGGGPYIDLSVMPMHDLTYEVN